MVVRVPNGLTIQRDPTSYFIVYDETLYDGYRVDLSLSLLRKKTPADFGEDFVALLIPEEFL